jgi:hypothetical protein
MPRLDTDGGQDIAQGIADHVGADGVLVVESDDVVSYAALLPGAPSVFTSSSNAIALDYDGIVDARHTMTENTTAAFSGLDNYANVILRIRGHASTPFTFTWPAGTIINTPNGLLVHTIVAASRINAFIYRDGDGTYNVTLSNTHVVGA